MHAARAVVLWIVVTYLADAVDCLAILAVTSPERRCGKTTLLGLLSLLVYRAFAAANVTPAAVFRIIERDRPSLIIDEADTFIATSDELRGVLNSGHTRATAFVLRVAGDEHEPRAFSTFCPKAIACIGNLAVTLADRSVAVHLMRRSRQEEVSPLRRVKGAAWDELRRQLVRWTRDHAAAIASADPEIPAELDDRAGDNWRPLLGIADAAGVAWGRLGREAARCLSIERDEPDSARLELLADIRTVFLALDEAQKPLVEVDRISTLDLVSRLTTDPTLRWDDYHKGQPLRQRQLAWLLKPYGIRPKSIRRDPSGDEWMRGFLRAWFVPAWDRYLGPVRPDDHVEGARPDDPLPQYRPPENRPRSVHETAEIRASAGSPGRCASQGDPYPCPDRSVPGYRSIRRPEWPGKPRQCWLHAASCTDRRRFSGGRSWGEGLQGQLSGAQGARVVRRLARASGLHHTGATVGGHDADDSLPEHQAREVQERPCGLM